MFIFILYNIYSYIYYIFVFILFIITASPEFSQLEYIHVLFCHLKKVYSYSITYIVIYTIYLCLYYL